MSTPATEPVDVNDPNTGLGLPALLDIKRASNQYTGTADHEGSIFVSSANGATDISGIQAEELPDSPELERAEQATSTKRFLMPYDSAVQLIGILGRGAMLTDAAQNEIRVLSARIQRQKPGMAILTIVSEGLSFDTPPDEFSMQPVELGVNIMKHPRYFYSLMPNDTDTALEAKAKQSIIRAIQTYQDSPMFPNKENLTGLLNGQVHNNITACLATGKFVINYPNPNYVPTIDFKTDTTIYPGYGTITPPSAATENGQTNDSSIHVSVDYRTMNNNSPSSSVQVALSAAQEIIQKIWRVEEEPALVGFEICWSVYYYRPPVLSPGGYIQDPITGTGFDNPGLPDYFWSNATAGSIFGFMWRFNPQCYNNTTSNGTAISWLRKADDIEYQRTWFKVTRRWLGSPIGAWDEQLYSQLTRPESSTQNPGAVYSTSYPQGYRTL